MSNELVEGEVENDLVTLTPLGEAVIMHNGAPLRLDMGKATDSDAGLRAYDEETIRIISERNEEAYGLLDTYESLKDEASRAKKAYENAVEDMQKLIRERRDERGKPQGLTLFDGSQNVADDETRQQVTTDDESWKSVTLTDMIIHDGLNQKVAEILSANGLDTLGKVTDYTNPNASGWCNSLTDFQGFGPKKIEQWQDACIRFWERWPNEQRTRSQDFGAGVEGGVGESGSAGSSDDDEAKFCRGCGFYHESCKCDKSEKDETEE